MKGLFQELKRRNVFKVGIAYAVTTWILLQLTDIVSDILVLPEWAPKLILLLLLVGFIPALIFAWAFEMTPEGIKLESEVAETRSVTKRTGRKLDYAIMILLGLSLAYFIWESRFEQRTTAYEQASQQAAEQPPAETVFEPVREVSPEDAEINKNSIAVLPFTNRSADQADTYFTDGIHDDLLTQLSRIDAFSVISRTSVMEYRDTTKNLREIARELSVANIMEGAVQRAGDRVRINVQLIDAETDEHLWAEIYDRELTTENLFDIQSEIAENIADALKATLTDNEIATMASAPTDNVAAYDLYLQARQFTLGETQIGYQTALELFKEAINQDPEFTRAWIGLGRAHITNYWNYGGDPDDRQAAREAIDQARLLDATEPELYMAEGFYWYWGHLDYERALYNLDKAIELMPRNEEAHMWKGWVSRRAGLWDQALASMEDSLRLNPRMHFHWVEYALTLMYLHRPDEARAALDKAQELNPNHFWTKDGYARLALFVGDFDSAIRYATGAQHGDEFSFFKTFMDAWLAADRFEEALEAAQNLNSDMEIQRQLIHLREMWTAQILHYMGREKESREAAQAAVFRLQGLRKRMGDDYRIIHAEALLSPLLGDTPEQVREKVSRSIASEPDDAVEHYRFNLQRAEIYAMAGMASEAMGLLEPLFSPPSETNVFVIEASPAFDGIRDLPGFIEMMEQHR